MPSVSISVRSFIYKIRFVVFIPIHVRFMRKWKCVSLCPCPCSQLYPSSRFTPPHRYTIYMQQMYWHIRMTINTASVKEIKMHFVCSNTSNVSCVFYSLPFFIFVWFDMFEHTTIATCNTILLGCVITSEIEMLLKLCLHLWLIWIELFVSRNCSNKHIRDKKMKLKHINRNVIQLRRKQ